MKFMKSKKLITLTTVLTMSLAMLTGCSSTKQQSQNDELVTEIKEPVEITFWHAMTGDLEKSLEKLTKSFMDENPNITVTLQNQSSYNDLQQKITATLASPQNLPTMTQAYTQWMYNPVQDGLITDLTPYIENETIKFDNYEDILPGLRESVEIDGKVYGMPFNKSTEVLWYNKTLLDELNIVAPTNYDELKEASKAIYEAKGIAGVGFDSLHTYYTTYLKGEGVDYDSNVDPTSEVSKEAANYYLDGVKEGYFRIAGTDKFLSGPFGSETVAMYVGSVAGASFVQQSVGDKFEIGVAPSPTEFSLQQGTDLYIFDSSTPEQKTAAYEYMKFLTTKDNQITWSLETGYMPIRQSAIDSTEYQSGDSLIAPILSDATKNLYTNPLVSGSDAAYSEASVVMETILADKNAKVDEVLANFKNTLSSIWE